ncbi:MAG: TIM barrel protein [Clostridia bacterium]|nr:TIM barrel protein [Clostridia bacterium]
MRIGLNYTPAHISPEDWAEKVRMMGAAAACFPVNYQAEVKLIDSYIEAARAHDILLAEVGVWNSPFHPDPETARQAMEKCVHQLELAEYVHARCCANVSGAAGERWAGCYRENFTPRHYERVVRMAQDLIDRVKPQHTFFTLEPMQWMPPDSPEQYEQLLRDIDRPAFAVHMDAVNFVKDPWTYTHQEELLERCFTLLGSRIRSCHLKDCLLENGTTVAIHEVQPGTGEFNIRAYLKHIACLEKDMPVLIEHLPDQAAYQRALDYVHSLMTEK